MSTDLLKHNDFGSCENLWLILFDVLDFDEPRPVRDIKSYSRGKSIDLSFSINAALDLIEFLGWIKIRGETILPTKIDDISKYKDREEALKKHIIETLIAKLKENDLLQTFICLESLKYDVVNDGIVLRNHVIPLEFSGLRNLFYELGLFIRHKSPTLIQINSKFTDYFIQEVISWAKEQLFNNIPAKALSYEQFLQIQDLKNKHGAEAEKFVYEFEQKRLKNHPQYKKIKIISNIDVGAGFDVVSFNDYKSEKHDRFIEVKSFSGDIQFYWSKNEIRVAELKQEQYFLYLVDRAKMMKEGYSPLIISNSFQAVFKNAAWLKNAETWKIIPIS